MSAPPVGRSGRQEYKAARPGMDEPIQILLARKMARKMLELQQVLDTKQKLLCRMDPSQPSSPLHTPSGGAKPRGQVILMPGQPALEYRP